MNSTATTIDTAPFVYNGDRHDNEQVRPYFADFSKILSDMEASGKFPYNDSFKGLIPGLANSDCEDRGIYMLQTMNRLDALAVKVEDFISGGGKPLTDFAEGETHRGTLVHYGFYMGGSGWALLDDTRVVWQRNGKGRNVQFKEPGQRSWRSHFGGPDQYLFRPNH